jgi:hypothetical protein
MICAAGECAARSIAVATKFVERADNRLHECC